MSDDAGRFGELAVDKGWIGADDVDAALTAQAELTKLGLPERIGEILRKRGLLSSDQVRELLLVQGAGPLRDLVPGYEILERLGQGGMGAVYRAKRRADGGLVALKLLPPRLGGNPEFVARFVREARAAASLKHPNIVAGLDAGCADDHYFVAMELVDGESLDQRLRRTGTLAEAEVLAVGRAVATALDHAHREGLVHRDVKPGNILLAKDPEGSSRIDLNGTVKLCDLGLAKWVADGGTAVTQTGLVVGTPQYVAPEQALGSEDVDIRADLYALGATLYHAATGRAPFTGGSGADVALRRLVADPTPVREVNPRVSPGCAELIEALLAREPAARPAEPADVLDAIDGLLRGDGWLGAPAPTATRRTAGVWIGSVAVGAVATAMLGATLGWGRGAPSPSPPTPTPTPADPSPSAGPDDAPAPAPALSPERAAALEEIAAIEADLVEFEALQTQTGEMLVRARERELHDQINVEQLIVFLGMRRQVADLRRRLGELSERLRQPDPDAGDRILRELASPSGR